MYFQTLIFYICSFIISCLPLYLSINKKYTIIFVSFILSLIFGLRIGIGNDYEQYVNIFNHITIYNDYKNVEIGYYYLNKLAYYLFKENGYYFVFCFSAFVTYYCFLKKATTYNIEKIVLLLLFIFGFIFFANNAIRQSAVIAIFIYNADNIWLNKRKYILVTIISALFFHYSAFLFLIFVFIRNKSCSRYTYIVIAIVSFLIYKLNMIDFGLKSIVDLIPRYGTMYLERVEDFKVKEIGNGLVIYYYYLILFFIIFFKDVLLKYKINENLFIFGFCLYLCGPQFEMWERITYIFLYITIIPLGAILADIWKKNYISFILVIIVYISMLFLFSYQVLNNANKNEAAPFHSLIFGDLN